MWHAAKTVQYLEVRQAVACHSALVKAAFSVVHTSLLSRVCVGFPQ